MHYRSTSESLLGNFALNSCLFLPLQFFNIDAGVLAELFSPGKLSDQDGKSSKIGNERSSPNMSVDVGSLSVTNFTLDSTSSKNK